MTAKQNTSDLNNYLDSLGNHKSVLYIDDEPQNLKSFKAIFRREFKIYTALNETEALQILRTHKIDKLMSDYKLPKTNGIQILDRIKEIYPKIKTAIITAHCWDIVNSDYPILLKPFQVKEINNYLYS